MEKVYYQPILTEKEWGETDLHSFEVYHTYEHAKKDFPNNIIGAYSGDEIENPTYRYDDETPLFYVDVPNSDISDEGWINVKTFETRQDAIDFAKEHFHADDNGMVSLISQS